MRYAFVLTVAFLMVVHGSGRSLAQLPPPSMQDLANALRSLGVRGGAEAARRAAYQGLTNLVVELARTDAKLAAKLHESGSARKLIANVIEHNSQLRTAVYNRVRSLSGHGRVVRRLLSNRNTWRGMRAASADLRIVASVATAIAAGSIGYVAGVRLARMKRRWERQHAATLLNERYGSYLASILEQTRSGVAELCSGMKYSEAATRLQINMQTSPRTPFAGILCRPQTQVRSATPNPNLRSSWASATCFSHYQTYVLSTARHASDGSGQGAFIAGLNPKTKKIFCHMPLTYGDISASVRQYLASCNNAVKPNRCRVVTKFRYR